MEAQASGEGGAAGPTGCGRCRRAGIFGRSADTLPGAPRDNGQLCDPGGRLSDIAALKARREQPWFAEWAGHVSDEHVEGATGALRELIDDIVALGPDPEEDDAREAVDKCVRRLNALDDGWITTMEREDLCEVIYKIVDLAGFEGDEDWTEE